MVYDYNKAIREDIRDYIKSEVDLEEWRGNRDGLEEKLNEDLWTVDSVTGNASGSYTFNTYEAEENLCHNLDLLEEACEEFGGSMDVLKDGAEVFRSEIVSKEEIPRLNFWRCMQMIFKEIFSF